MSRLEIRWPDAATERVRAARGRLERAAQLLREMTFEERVTGVSEALALWTSADSPWRRELAIALGEQSDFDPRTVAEGLESALRAWSPTRFAELCREEIATQMPSSSGRRLLPFEWTAVLAGGSIPMPTILSGLLPLVLGSAVMLRETSADPITPGLLRRSLESRDERLARAFEAIGFASDDEEALAAFLEAPCVVATGSDETIRSLTARLRPSQRFVAYGHRFSIGVLGPEAGRDAARRAEMAKGLALDVARWDQSGCLSPIVVYLVGLDAAAHRLIARSLATALERLSEEMPRGAVSKPALAALAIELREARMRAASDPAVEVIEGHEAILVLEADARPRPAPLHRFLRLHPVDDAAGLARALEPFRGQLSNVALAGFPEDVRRSLEDALAPLGVSRFTAPGQLQTPPVDWPHDGLPLLLPMARFGSTDGLAGD